jgi:hypothetical protein
MRNLAALIVALLIPSSAFAQRLADPNEFSHAMTVIGRDSVSGLPCYVGISATCQLGGGGSGGATGPAPTTASSTAAGNASTSATAGSATQLQAANGARKGCNIQNQSTTAVLQVLQSAGTGVSVLWNVAPGNSFSCAAGGIVISDALSVQSTAASVPYGYAFQ